MSKCPSILLVEDHQVLRLGLRISLESLGCCQILGEVEDGEAAVREAQKLRPDIILMDVGLPGIDGIEATWRIKQELPRTRIIMLTSHTTPEYVTAALGAGADGYCSKDAPIERIVSAMDAVMSGQVWLDPAIANVVVQSRNNEDGKSGKPLSKIEMQILALIQQGMDNREIAIRLNETTEKVALIMHKFIDRFVNNTSLINAEKKRNESPDEWLIGFDKSQLEGRIFAEKYVIESLLGYGSLGAVFKAKHLYMDRYVAVKVLRPELCADRLIMRYFQREASAIASLQHENIVGLHDFGISKEHEPYLILEYVDGTDLGAILEKENPLPVRRTLDICVQVCAGLAEAHSKGIVHCDLKPSNILIHGSRAKEHVKIADFGLAQILPSNSTTDLRATDKFFVSGTPLYMSPEQSAGSQLDSRSDIYSLGCILYEVLTGVNVFEGTNAIDTLSKQTNLIPPPMSSVYAGSFSPSLESCVERMLAKDPALRPQSMEEVMALLLSNVGQHQ